MEDHRRELYKDTMQKYFLIENKTLDEVMQLMKNKLHARYSRSQEFRNSHIAKFVDSKAQYERQFKKWKFRKNRKQHDWASAGRIMKKRKRGGKESDVYIDGVLVETKKMCKGNFAERPSYLWPRYICHNFWYSLDYLNSRSTKSENTRRILHLHAPSLFA